MKTKKLRFGDLIENGYASKNNPHRTGIFVKYYYRHGKVNPGKTNVLTNGSGDFWEMSACEEQQIKLGNITMLKPNENLYVISLFDKTVKAAVRLIDHLTKHLENVPDEFWAPYECEYTSLVWELTRKDREDKHHAQIPQIISEEF
jgi:hypothetical protein